MNRQHQGAGLGLVISKHLVHLMDGSMAVESEPGLGTSFYFCVGFEEADTMSPNAGETCSLAKVLPLRVLVAEDDQTSRIFAARLLERFGHDVTPVENGKRVLETLKDGTFDVVFMDVQMPIMDGVEATRAIREGLAGQANRDIPIIALTAYAMTGDKEAFLGAGMNGYVSKPVEQKSVQAALEMAFNNGHLDVVQ